METIDKIVKSSIAPKRTDVVWFNTTDKSQYIFTPDGKWTKVSGGGDSTDGIQKITYLELKKLRNQGKLIPGKQYRITDYKCAVKEIFTSAGHQFDIIVTADTENTLNENARACNHDDFINTERTYAIINWDDEHIEIYVRAPESDTTNPDDIDGTKALPLLGETAGYAWIYVGEGTDVNNILWDNVDFKNNHVEYSTSETLKVGDYISNGDGLVLETGVVSIDVHDYFEQCNLSAWELKYTLDVQNYGWGAPEIGKTTILAKFCPNPDKDPDYYVRNAFQRMESLDNEKGYAWKKVSFTSTSPESFSFDNIIINWGSKSSSGILIPIGSRESDEDLILYTPTDTPSIGSTGKCFNYKGLDLTEWEIADFCSNTQTLDAPESGTGLVYYMKDEYNNSCNYDFKNIQFWKDGNVFYTFTIYDKDVNGTDGTVDGSCANNTINMDPIQLSFFFDFSISNYPQCLDNGVTCQNGIQVYGEYKTYRGDSSISNIEFYEPAQYVLSYSGQRTISIIIENDGDSNQSISFSGNYTWINYMSNYVPSKSMVIIDAVWDSTKSLWLLKGCGFETIATE